MPLNLGATDQQIQKTDPKAPVALVIGSGFGGLAAAVRMCAKGWRVQVLEKLNEPGGGLVYTKSTATLLTQARR